MKFDKAYFDQEFNRKGSGCTKWDGPACPEGALPMWIADMDFACAPAIADAVLKRAQHPCFGYPAHDNKGMEAFCGFWQRRHQLQVVPEQVLSLPGVVTGIRAAVNCFTKPGDGIAVMPPVYGPFFFSVKDADRKIVECPLQEDANGRPVMNYEALENAFRDGVRMVILCNPHNPVGRVWEKEELEKLLALALAYDVIVISDEIHAEFVYKPHVFVPMLSLEGAKEKVITLVAASKAFNLAGLQQAEMIIMNPDMYNVCKQHMNAHGISSGNTFALVATEAAYSECDEWLEGLIEYLDEGRKLLKGYVEDMLPKAKMREVEGTYLAWIDLRAYGFNTEQLNQRCLDAGVVFNRGTFFGEMGDGFVRINFGCPHSHLKEGVVRLKRALGE